jgi:hypothetical protein
MSYISCRRIYRVYILTLRVWVTFHTPGVVSHSSANRRIDNVSCHIVIRLREIELSVTLHFRPPYFIDDSFDSKNTKFTQLSLSVSTLHVWLKWTERVYRPPSYYRYFGLYVTESISEKELIRKVTLGLWKSAWWEWMVNYEGVKLKTAHR